MYAVVETDGRQYQVTEGRYIDVDLINNEPEDKVTYDKVVAIIAGEKTQIGQPYIEGATISAKILNHGKSKKVIAYKMRRKKGYRLKKGHRQNFTRILIENIEFPNKEETLNYVNEVEANLAKELKAREEKLQIAKQQRENEKTEKKAKKQNAE